MSTDVWWKWEGGPVDRRVSNLRDWKMKSFFTISIIHSSIATCHTGHLRPSDIPAGNILVSQRLAAYLISLDFSAWPAHMTCIPDQHNFPAHLTWVPNMDITCIPGLHTWPEYLTCMLTWPTYLTYIPDLILDLHTSPPYQTCVPDPHTSVAYLICVPDLCALTCCIHCSNTDDRLCATCTERYSGLEP